MSKNGTKFSLDCPFKLNRQNVYKFNFFFIIGTNFYVPYPGSASASGIRIWNADSGCGSRSPKSCGSMRMRIRNTGYNITPTSSPLKITFFRCYSAQAPYLSLLFSFVAYLDSFGFHLLSSFLIPSTFLHTFSVSPSPPLSQWYPLTPLLTPQGKGIFFKIYCTPLNEILDKNSAEN